MRTIILAVLLAALASGAQAQIYGQHDNSFTVYTVPQPPAPPTMHDWQRFAPQYQQVPPPPPRTCRIVNNMMYCQ